MLTYQCRGLTPQLCGKAYSALRDSRCGHECRPGLRFAICVAPWSLPAHSCPTDRSAAQTQADHPGLRRLPLVPVLLDQLSACFCLPIVLNLSAKPSKPVTFTLSLNMPRCR